MRTNPNDIIIPIVNSISESLSESLRSVIIHGDALSHEYVSGKSPVSLLFVVDNCNLDAITSSSALLASKSNKIKISPKFMSGKMFEDAVMFFPVEIVSIQRSYRILQGEDLFKNLIVCKDRLLEQCRREISGLLVHLSSEYVVHRNEKRTQEKLLQSVQSSLIPVFSALLKVYDKKVPHSTSEVIASVEDLYSLGSSVISDIYLGTNRVTLHKAFIELYGIINQIYEETDRIKIDDQENVTHENELIL